MPKTHSVAYREDDGTAPILEWLEELVPKARAKCRARLGRLAALGHELRRPEADYLGDGIYELRTRHHDVNLRMLYSFHRRRTVFVSHGITKQQAKVPDAEIELAIRRKTAFEVSPRRHTYEGGVR